ncbi:MAG TPA: histidine kinase, partial [Flavisolibacter sp.]
ARSADIQAKYRFITPGGLVAIVMWMIVLFFMFTGDAAHEVVAAWCVIIPFAILYYWYSFHTLIPRALPRKRPFTSYLGRTILVLALTGLPVGLFALLLSQNDEAAISITFLNMAFQLMVIAPFTWVVFQRYIRGNEELSFLKKELGQTNASFDFLRSQINPHFLFNALNTIYGTALQEKAERTSEGIEKLGDMMRFMLQENMQENIPLAREVEYLDNYIGLQRLRTDANPIVRIESAIQQPVAPVRIAPMLLIPFVENAFKHGISLREPSHIKINLELRGATLYFDVYNSKHEKQDTDPEKNKSGIGLNNVRQRLELMYPKKHELVIRETGREFFVHLTIQLT